MWWETYFHHQQEAGEFWRNYLSRKRSFPRTRWIVLGYQCLMDCERLLFFLLATWISYQIKYAPKQNAEHNQPRNFNYLLNLLSNKLPSLWHRDMSDIGSIWMQEFTPFQLGEIGSLSKALWWVLFFQHSFQRYMLGSCLKIWTAMDRLHSKLFRWPIHSKKREWK